MDLKKPATVVQALFLAALLAAVGVMVVTAHDNLTRQNIATGFGFLFDETGWDLGASLIQHSARDPYWRTFLVGLLNTLLLAFICIVLATFLGVLVALVRTSGNPVMAGLSAFYINTCRNIPLLVQVFFWYQVTRYLPPVRQAISLGDVSFLSNRGLYVPSVAVDIGLAPIAVAVLACAVLLLAFRAVNGSREKAGAPPYPYLFLFGAWLAVVAVIAAIARPEITVSVPRLTGFNFQGGMALSPEFTALVTAIVIYNAAFIAEIVRSGILSVPKGQVQAARNIGLSPGVIYWKIVIPQAFRVAIPPLTNQSIFIAKESSLAVAIGYTDLFSVGTVAINHTGQSIEVIAVLMLVYLAISFGLSGVGNHLNRSITRRWTR
jgi:general L-amino acid transport system permease protein